MRKIVIVDDINGEDGARPVTFALDGSGYEIDLTDANRSALAGALAPFIAAARRVPPKIATSSLATPAAMPKVDRAQLQAWAAAHGVELPARGRVPRAIVEQYEAWSSSTARRKRA